MTNRMTEAEYEAHQARMRRLWNRTPAPDIMTGASTPVLPPAPTKIARPGGRGGRPGHKAGVPNKTENRFAMEQLPLIQSSWDELRFEPFTLRFELDGQIRRYTPDWVTWLDGQISCYETKGGQPDSRDSQLLFRLAKTNFPMFHFEAWRFKDKTWRRIWS